MSSKNTKIQIMKNIFPQLTRLFVLLSLLALAQQAAATETGMPNPPSSPTVVKVGVFLMDIVDLDEANETFQAEFVIGTEWMDPRLAFDPDEMGTDRKLFQGPWQFVEVFTGWWPQLLITNEIGLGSSNAVRLVVHADGRVRYMEQRSVTLETPMQLRRFPFDRQVLAANIISFGDHSDQVLLEVDERILGATEEFAEQNQKVHMAQWRFENLHLASREADFRYYGGEKVFSEVQLTISLARESANFVWKIIVPLIILVLLMWVVFWLEVDSLSERLNLAFIGVLTIVAYQFLIDGTMPRISYFTFTDTILFFSFTVMCLAIFESLVVYALYRAGHKPLAERIDTVAQWIFPMIYFAGLAASYIYYQI